MVNKNKKYEAKEAADSASKISSNAPAIKRKREEKEDKAAASRPDEPWVGMDARKARQGSCSYKARNEQ